MYQLDSNDNFYKLVGKNANEVISYNVTDSDGQSLTIYLFYRFKFSLKSSFNQNLGLVEVDGTMKISDTNEIQIAGDANILTILKAPPQVVFDPTQFNGVKIDNGKLWIFSEQKDFVNLLPGYSNDLTAIWRSKDNVLISNDRRYWTWTPVFGDKGYYREGSGKALIFDNDNGKWEVKDEASFAYKYYSGTFEEASVNSAIAIDSGSKIRDQIYNFNTTKTFVDNICPVDLKIISIKSPFFRK